MSIAAGGAESVVALREVATVYPADYREGGLHVGWGSMPLQPFSAVVFGGLSMSTDEGAKNFDDGGQVPVGVLGDALQCVDTAQRHVHLVIASGAELVYCPGLPLPLIRFWVTFVGCQVRPLSLGQCDYRPQRSHGRCEHRENARPCGGRGRSLLARIDPTAVVQRGSQPPQHAQPNGWHHQ